MDDDTDPFDFPALPDEAEAALNQFLEAFYDHFQNHYFAQLQRCHHALDQRQHYQGQRPLPLDEPPF